MGLAGTAVAHVAQRDHSGPPAAHRGAVLPPATRHPHDAPVLWPIAIPDHYLDGRAGIIVTGWPPRLDISWRVQNQKTFALVGIVGHGRALPCVILAPGVCHQQTPGRAFAGFS